MPAQRPLPRFPGGNARTSTGTLFCRNPGRSRRQPTNRKQPLLLNPGARDSCTHNRWYNKQLLDKSTSGGMLAGSADNQPAAGPRGSPGSQRRRVVNDSAGSAFAIIDFDPECGIPPGQSPVKCDCSRAGL